MLVNPNTYHFLHGFDKCAYTSMHRVAATAGILALQCIVTSGVLSEGKTDVNAEKVKAFLEENNADADGHWETSVARKYCEVDGKRLCAAHHRHLAIDAVEVCFYPDRGGRRARLTSVCVCVSARDKKTDGGSSIRDDRGSRGAGRPQGSI